MNRLSQLYKPSLAMATDLYQLTMAYGYWQSGRGRDEAVFNLFFRTAPFGSGYTIAAGLGTALEYIENFSFADADCEYLATIKGADEAPLFPRAFLNYLRELRLSVDIDAIEEGTVVFPGEPLLRVRGPLLECQLLETALLNTMNFQTLVATKAARMRQASGGDPIIEFGLRRAQGFDGGVSASRAAYIGGASATSNVLAGQLLGIPVKGTHAHSWVMSFDDEPAAFAAYAEAMPNNAIFLVDTYDTLTGVANAIEAGRQLRQRGHKLLGIRLDSGDLAWLAKRARAMLDEAGFHETAIVASNDLDEHLIESLKIQEAPINVWGVGTKLATAYEQPALGGVYKLSAIKHESKEQTEWRHTLKVSEQALKTNVPGILGVRRYRHNGIALADMIYDELTQPADPPLIIDPLDPMRRRQLTSDMRYEELLVPVVRDGKLQAHRPLLDDIRDRVRKQLSLFDASIKRFANPHTYPVGLEANLQQRRSDLILAARGNDEHNTF